MTVTSRKVIACVAGAAATVVALLVVRSHRASDSVPTAASIPDEVSVAETQQPRPALASGLLDATSMSTLESPKRLYLIETAPGRTPAEGSAKIGIDPSAPQSYSAGAFLLNGARLTEIHNRYVVLERGHEKVRLDLFGRTGAKGPSSSLAFVGGAAPEVEKRELAVDRLSRVLRMAPVYENDLLVGMRIFPGTDSSLFSQFGLRPGDVVMAIDGAPVVDASAMTELLTPLATGAQMQFSLRRGGAIQEVLLDGSFVTREFDASPYASQQHALPPPG